MLEWDFRTAERFFPKNKLIINEEQEDIWMDFRGNRSPYYMLIERTLRNGCRIDSIGMQFHVYKQEETYGKYMYSPMHLYRVMDKYADFNLPIQITESSIPCYEYGADEEIQAEILKNLYSIWFSHPCMEAIIYWDFVDGYDWKPYNFGFVKKDLTPKPAYYVVRDLFKKTWHTELETETKSAGVASFKAFYGDYEITVRANGKEVTQNRSLLKGGKRDFKITI